MNSISLTSAIRRVSHRMGRMVRKALALQITLVLAFPIPLGPLGPLGSSAMVDMLGSKVNATWKNAIGYLSGVSIHEIFNPLGRSHLKTRRHAAVSALSAISAATQAQQVAYIQFCPRRLVLFVGERQAVEPLAMSATHEVVHGAPLDYASHDALIVTVTSYGELEAHGIGTTTVEVGCGVATTQLEIEVRAGTRDVSSNVMSDMDAEQGCAAEQASAYTAQPLSTLSTLAPSAAPQAATDPSASRLLNGGDPVGVAFSQATSFENAVGNPRFTPRLQSGITTTQLGSQNYQFTAPVVEFGGRGMALGLSLTYNSRVWNSDDTKIMFNFDGAWLAPGWSLGYGKIIRNYNATAVGNGSGVGSGNNPGDYLLVLADGTRIHLDARLDSATGRWFHLSEDGSFLRFDPLSGELSYPDGTKLTYSSINGVLLPTVIKNTNGAVLTLGYRDYCEGAACLKPFRYRTALNAMRDTLGRHITFHYYGDSDYPADAVNGMPDGELAEIKAPDMNGVQQAVIRVEYQNITLRYDYGRIPVDAPASGSEIKVVRRIAYPQTGRGFLFEEYSTYAIARRISSRTGMNIGGGRIGDGSEVAFTSYNYLTLDASDPFGRNQVGSLDEFPQFTRREEWWEKKTDNNGTPTNSPTLYDYVFTASTGSTGGAAAEVSTMTQAANNMQVVVTTGADSTQLTFGKVISVETKRPSDGAQLSKQVYTYVTGPDAEPEIDAIETTNEVGESSLVRTTYGSFGRIQNVYEYGIKQGGGYSVQRRTGYDYVDAGEYLAERMLRLVTRVSVYDGKNNNSDGDDELKSRAESIYDDYGAMGGMEGYGLGGTNFPPNHDGQYNQSRTLRGNVTGVRTYPDVGGAPIQRNRKYDIFGNVVVAEVSCCSLKRFGYSSLTAFSAPDITQDGGGGLTLSGNIDYNYFTGLVTRQVNADGLVTSYEYDNALRLERVILPTGAVTVTRVDRDGNNNDQLSYTELASYSDEGVSRIITTKSWFDGAGRVLKSGSGAGAAPASFDLVAAKYDSLGRAITGSNPYRGDASGNGAVSFESKTRYDELGRVTEIELPDHSKTVTSYSGRVVTVTDAVGRQRRAEVDGLGRTVKVIEQNPNTGALDEINYLTSYRYDALNNLVEVNQGGQLRSFQYDALGRLVEETTPEAGRVSYSYTDFNAVRTRTDARGVVTTYEYGDLNLPKSVSYNTTGAAGVAATPGVGISYRTQSPAKAAVETVTDGGGSERYGYDALGRVIDKTRTIEGIEGQSYQTQYEYNTANQMVLIGYPSGKRVRMRHDERGRVSAIERVDISNNVQERYVSEVQYRVEGLVSSQKLGSGVVEEYGYSADRLQLTSQRASKDGNALMNVTYGYTASAGQMGTGTSGGNTGQLIGISGTINGQSRDQSFSYDTLGRLKTATGFAVWERRFEYDRWGNRTGMWDRRDGGTQLQNVAIQDAGAAKTNRIASVNGVNYSHDASGNVTSDGVHTFQYDAENRMVSVDAGVTARYTYDSNNWRVKKEAGGVVTHYVWEGGQVIAEYEFGGGNNTSGAGVRYYEPDRLSTRVITNGSGAVVGTLDQLPFGEEVGTAGESEKHKFTSYERDSETGTDYAVNRQYQNALGRFMRPDPYGGSMSITDPQSFNRYTYVGNDPVNSIDPLGLFESTAHERELLLKLLLFILAAAEVHNGEGGGGGGDGFFTPPAPAPGPIPEPPPAPAPAAPEPPQAPPQTQRDCDFPSFNQLSSAQQGVLGPGGASIYDGLSQTQRASFLNITGALSRASVSVGGLRLSGVQQDRLSFAAGTTGGPTTGFEGSVRAGIVAGRFTEDTPNASLHPGMSDFGARENREFNALQIGIGTSGGGFADIDRGNPRGGFGGLLVHTGELITPGRTDPFAVGRALGKGVTGYNCK